MDSLIEKAMRIIGAPIDANHSVSVELTEICNIPEPAAPGELCYTFVPDDSNGVDKIYTSGSEGQILTIKVKLAGLTSLNFEFLQSKEEYVLVQELAESPDTNALARRKVSIGRAMDKLESKRVYDLVLALDGDTDVGLVDQEVARTTGEDIYDLIVAMVRKVENYANDYVLLAGNTAYAEIEDYDKANADNFLTAVSIFDLLKRKGITLIKVFENIQLRNADDNSGSDVPVLAADKMILIGRNSKLLAGKPILFMRRQVRALVANAGGTFDVDERALYTAETPSPMYNGTVLTHGYGIFGFESIVAAILNYRAVCWADSTVVS